MLEVLSPGAEAGAVAQSENAVLAARLRDYAALLDDQGSAPFRARAYQKAADVV
jgi:hypothetical protein